jgi:hypothetical protein
VNLVWRTLSKSDKQFNFFDHTKLILSENGLVVSFIDKHYTLHTFSLDALVSPLPYGASEKDTRKMSGIVHKMAYARSVLRGASPGLYLMMRRDVLGKIKLHEQPTESQPVPTKEERFAAPERPQTRSQAAVAERPIR